jgi:hypothetical protein
MAGNVKRVNVVSQFTFKRGVVRLKSIAKTLVDIFAATDQREELRKLRPPPPFLPSIK